MIKARLDGPADFEGWRDRARRLLAAGAQPQDVVWITDDDAPDLFLNEDSDPPPSTTPFAVPRRFIDVAASAALHSDPERFSLLYRLLWRLQNERRLMDVASDPDVARATFWAKGVARDIHKMHAFVRFRSIETDGAEHFVAWHEPAHHVVEAASPFFMRRFATMLWTILTPERSASWDGRALTFGPGARPSDAPAADPLEDMWRGYYANIFNPARLNPKAMQAEMPKRFWKNLPEASLIGPLMAEAASRTRAMIAAEPVAAVRRRGAEIMENVAPAADAWESLRRDAAACRACPLWEPATQTVFGEGPREAAIMLIGEQPGDQEDIQGRPFVGPAGRLLDKALEEAGLDRSRLYVTNAVKHFKFEPRGKRRIHKTPGPAEIRACSSWLDEELAHVSPRLVVLLGATAAQTVLGRPVKIGQSRGRVGPLDPGRDALITVHPSFLLRLPDEEAKTLAFREFVRDLRVARDYASERPS